MATKLITYDDVTKQILLADGSSSGGAGTPTTPDPNADTMFAASATNKSALVIQAKPAPTAPPFVVQKSDGIPEFQVQSDGGVIIDQRTGAVFTFPLDVYYQGVRIFGVSAAGIAQALTGFNGGGGFFTTDSSGNVVSLANVTGRHFLGNGTSPTVASNGNNDCTIAGKDSFFKVTVGTGLITSIVITLGTAFATAPVVLCSASVSVGVKVASTSTTVTLSSAGFTAAEVLHVMCGGF